MDDEAKSLFKELKESLKDAEDDRKEHRYSHIRGPLGPLSLLGSANLSDYDEVYPGIYIGKGDPASDIHTLRNLKVTHVLNAAHGQRFAQINTDPSLYADFKITFLGLPAMDVMNYPISKHFNEANEFIKDALDSGGVVYVHCHQGRSRSATMVLTYLMMTKGLSVQEALRTVREKRKVEPNDGFLKQLVKLQLDLNKGGEISTDAELQD